MPLFEFRCSTCGAEFESLCRAEAVGAVSCPECGARHASRLISRFAVSRRLTPCGAPRSEAPAACGLGARDGGCDSCRAPAFA
ncbi:MAG: zinc ribbon domain-containing protein [Chthonomonadales bacterium]|nr:zinc ribbon domain-containing protein [Chthonomonadales bacterium]